MRQPFLRQTARGRPLDLSLTELKALPSPPLPRPVCSLWGGVWVEALLLVKKEKKTKMRKKQLIKYQKKPPKKPKKKNTKQHKTKQTYLVIVFTPTYSYHHTYPLPSLPLTPRPLASSGLGHPSVPPTKQHLCRLMVRAAARRKKYGPSFLSSSGSKKRKPLPI